MTVSAVSMRNPMPLHDPLKSMVSTVSMHMMNYVEPSLQRYAIRILWMVPIYAVESWFSLRFKDVR